MFLGPVLQAQKAHIPRFRKRERALLKNLGNLLVKSAFPSVSFRLKQGKEWVFQNLSLLSFSIRILHFQTHEALLMFKP
ncbi:unnamed protein product [Citrullus colocynthis]|uniref:Uncharacterized protein n=1 Tax=Citrullus colocynthis TaxID=252529 RepID=A0ABP0XXL5_9ROSI